MRKIRHFFVHVVRQKIDKTTWLKKGEQKKKRDGNVNKWDQNNRKEKTMEVQCVPL